ncbi:MAG: sulfite oxidase, partial [Actinomycetes bacterium]
GMASVKWLRHIEVVADPFEGYQMRAYSLRQHSDDVGEPLTRIAPRALVVPPGFPDFMSRRRVLRPGSHVIEGRAWSGWGEVVAVEVTMDGGLTWTPAELGPQVDRWAWRRWTLPWQVEHLGTYVLQARATDASGRRQPAHQPWNRGGFANSTPQSVEVTVVA